MSRYAATLLVTLFLLTSPVQSQPPHSHNSGSILIPTAWLLGSFVGIFGLRKFNQRYPRKKTPINPIPAAPAPTICTDCAESGKTIAHLQVLNSQLQAQLTQRAQLSQQQVRAQPLPLSSQPQVTNQRPQWLEYSYQMWQRRNSTREKSQAAQPSPPGAEYTSDSSDIKLKKKSN